MQTQDFPTPRDSLRTRGPMPSTFLYKVARGCNTSSKGWPGCAGDSVLLPPYSPGEESFKPICSFSLWIFSRHMAFSSFKMQLKCMAVVCRAQVTDTWDGPGGQGCSSRSPVP